MSVDAAQLPEASTDGERKTLECICPQCGLPGDAICPHCRAEYSPDSPVDEYHFKVSTPEEMLSRFSGLARFITGKRNAKFWWACFLVAAGDAAAQGVSMKDLASKWRTTRANVSKVCVEICGRLGMQPSQYMRGESARESYRKSNWRNGG